MSYTDISCLFICISYELEHSEKQILVDVKILVRIMLFLDHIQVLKLVASIV